MSNNKPVISGTIGPFWPESIIPYKFFASDFDSALKAKIESYVIIYRVYKHLFILTSIRSNRCFLLLLIF